MNKVYQEFKERFGLEGALLIGGMTLGFASVGLVLGTVVALNMKPAMIFIENNKEEN